MASPISPFASIQSPRLCLEAAGKELPHEPGKYFPLTRYPLEQSPLRRNKTTINPYFIIFYKFIGKFWEMAHPLQFHYQRMAQE